MCSASKTLWNVLYLRSRTLLTTLQMLFYTPCLSVTCLSQCLYVEALWGKIVINLLSVPAKVGVTPAFHRVILSVMIVHERGLIFVSYVYQV